MICFDEQSQDTMEMFSHRKILMLCVGQKIHIIMKQNSNVKRHSSAYNTYIKEHY